MPKTITGRIPFLRPSSRKIAVASVANAAYDRGWKDHEATTVASGTGPEVITDYWTAALKFRGTGRTSKALRAMAADPEVTRGLAILSGVSEDTEREQMLGIADAIDVLESHRLTPEDCYNLAGLDRLLGCPFAEFDPDAAFGPAPAAGTPAAA